MEIDETQFREYLKNPILFPSTFKDYIADYFATNVPKLHVSQIFGFKLQSVKDATEVTALDVVSSTAYGALGTAGPSLDQINNGFYIALFGATYGNSAGQPFYAATEIYMSPVIDGAAASDDDAAVLNAGSNGRAVLLDLTTGDHDHTITFHYKRVGADATRAVWNRWLYLIKVVSDDTA